MGLDISESAPTVDGKANTPPATTKNPANRFENPFMGKRKQKSGKS